MADQEVHFKDFSKKRMPVYFMVDGDRFDCRKSLSPIRLQEFVRMIRRHETDETNAIERVLEAMRMILFPESYARFIERMQNDEDEENSIDMEQLGQITEWVLETYTDRPLEVSSNSSNSLVVENTGTSLTDGVQPKE